MPDQPFLKSFSRSVSCGLQQSLFTLFCAVFLCLSCLPAAAAPGLGTGERIHDFHSDLTVHNDGALTVTETVTVTALGQDIKRGIFRDIPLRHYDTRGMVRHIDLKVLDVRRDGAYEAHHTERIRGGIRIYLGKENYRLPPGVYTYELTYRIYMTLGLLAEFDELYWNVTGNGWSFPIDRAAAVIHLPPGAELLQSYAYTGYTRERGSDFKITENAGSVGFETTRRLEKYEGLTVAAGWPKGHIIPPQRLELLRIFVRNNIVTVIGGLLFLLVNLVFFITWVLRGQDPKKGTIIPQFFPPENFSPVLTHYVTKRDLKMKTAFAAAMTDLAVKGTIRIIERDIKGHYQIDLLSGDLSGLPAAEKTLIRHLFQNGNNSLILTKKYDHHFSQALRAFEKAVEKEYKGVYFIKNSKIAITLALISYTYLAIVFEGEYIAVEPGALALALGFIIINIMYFYLLEAPTMRGRKKMDHLEGFKMYLQTAEKDRIDFLHPPEMTPELFEKYLPYAIALGVENKWVAKFKKSVPDHIYKNYRSSWYHGGGNFSAATLSSGMGSSFGKAVSHAGGAARAEADRAAVVVAVAAAAGNRIFYRKGDNMLFWVITVISAIVAVYYFNRLVGQTQRVNEGWSGIDVQLKRRADLIPALVETVNGYAKHEQGLLTRVTELRAKAVAEQFAPDITARNAAESGLASSIGRLFAVIENYPALKADENFRQLHESLVEVEEHLQFARRYYNGTARDMNILVGSFPGNIVAKLGKFKTAQFFEIDNPLEQHAPKVDLETDNK